MDPHTLTTVPHHLTALDWMILGLSLVLTALAAWFGQRRSKPQQMLDMMLMGRQLTLPLFVSTMVATWYGNLFGVTQVAFERGLYAWLTQGCFWYLAYLLLAVLWVKKIHLSKATGLAALIAQRFGRTPARFTAVLIFVKTLPVTYTINLGLLIQALFGLGFLSACTIGLLSIGLYTQFGGFRAVVYSDVVQCVFMCAAAVSVLAVSWHTYGGLSFLTPRLPTEFFSPLPDAFWADGITWLGIALATTIINPALYQRCLAAKTPACASLGLIACTIIWMLFDACTIAGALYAKAILPDAHSLTAYLDYALMLLPTGLKGIFIAGCLATICSSLDSYLLLAQHTLTYDLKLWRQQPQSWRHAFCLLLTGALTLTFILTTDLYLETLWLRVKSIYLIALLTPILFSYYFNCTDACFFFIASLAGLLLLYSLTHMDVFSTITCGCIGFCSLHLLAAKQSGEVTA